MAKFISRIKQRYTYSARLLRQLVITDFKLRYKGSALGYVWTVLKPLMLFAIMYLVFINFLKFGADEPHFAVQLLLGLILWNYFVEVTMNGMSAIVGRGDLMRKLSFPRYVIVLAGSFSAIINLAINLCVVLVLVLLNGVQLTWHALLIIPIIIELFAFALGLALLLAALYVKLRDLNYIWEVFLQAGMYATPIIYPVSLILQYSPLAAKIAMLNPMAQIIQDARHVVVSQDVITVWRIFDGGIYAYIPLFIVVAVLVVATIYFKKASPNFAEEV